jgi:hypothetical protein
VDAAVDRTSGLEGSGISFTRALLSTTAVAPNADEGDA